MTIQGWFPLGWTGLISLLTMGLSRALQHHSSKASILQRSAFFMVQLLHPYMTTGKTISSVQFSCSVVSSSLWPHGLQHARLPCPSPSPRVCSNSCPLRWWCHPPILSSVIPFSSCLQFFSASRSFLMSQLFTSGSQSIGASASASVLPMNIRGWFPLGLTDLISLQSKGLKSLLQHHSSKASILLPSVFFMIQLSHPYMTTGKTIALTRQTFWLSNVYAF